MTLVVVNSCEVYGERKKRTVKSLPIKTIANYYKLVDKRNAVSQWYETDFIFFNNEAVLYLKNILLVLQIKLNKLSNDKQMFILAKNNCCYCTLKIFVANKHAVINRDVMH